jgi:hypothetical protein
VNRANQMRNDECGMRNERQRREPGAEEGGEALRCRGDGETRRWGEPGKR